MTDSAPYPAQPGAATARFVTMAAGWNLLLFAALRSTWFVTYAGQPFVALQQTIATWYGGGSPLPVTVTLECSGTDVMALCAGVVFAYPAPWTRRVRGVALILPALLLLNLVRIDTLALAAGTASFQLLHLYVWPAILMAAAAFMVFRWMQVDHVAPASPRRGVLLVAGCLGGFALITPVIASGQAVAALCEFVAGAGAQVLRAMGADATAHGTALATPRGAFQVTPDCLLSPIIPLWVVAVLWRPRPRWQQAVGVALTLPVVTALAVVRLFALAAPDAWVDAPLIVVHGFHQFVIFAALIVIAAAQAAPAGRPWAGAMKGLMVATVAGLTAVMAGASYNAAVLWVAALATTIAPHTLRTWWQAGDLQGALLVLPAYQLALFAALLAVRERRIHWRPAAGAAVVLTTTHLALLLALGEVSAHIGWQPHALLVRAWAVALPLVMAWWVRARRADEGLQERDAAYRRFWDQVGADFPDLGGAASTEYYAANERRLVARYLPNLTGARVLKTDLWDEARNTRILQWMQRQGARVAGIDISGPVVRMAQREFHGVGLPAAGGDVRAIPFPDRTFDAVYSMGTVEHVDETDTAIAECFRVLKPGGRVIMGVPNRHDPFLRPLLVACLYYAGLYDYGFEKSYSRRTLRRMLEEAGFTVVGDEAILFIPGWLRMLDLLCHTRVPALTTLTGAGVRFFEWVDMRVPAVRRHGYLLAMVGERPLETTDRAPVSFSSRGAEWIVDARGCDPAALRSRATLEALVAEIIAATRLTPVAPGLWHVFGGEAGVTGLQMLKESHIACHTYPEAGYAAFSLYCCRIDPVDWPWQARLMEALGAADVSVRVLAREPLVADAIPAMGTPGA